jgi:hypothetical protein
MDLSVKFLTFLLDFYIKLNQPQDANKTRKINWFGFCIKMFRYKTHFNDLKCVLFHFNPKMFSNYLISVR